MRNLELKVPTSLESITLRQYQKYLKIADKNKGDEYNDFLNKKIVEIFCNVNLNDVESIPVVEFDKVLKIISKAFSKDWGLTRRFKLLDVDMGFIPKLDDMSLGEYVDVESGISDWQDMHKAMAVLYRPVNFTQKDKYTIAPYSPSDQVKELMKDMPLNIVMGAVVFFYNLGIELSKASLNSLEMEAKRAKTSRLKEALVESGVGINQFMDSLKATSQSLTKLQKNPFLSV
tara:strand:- start:10996 stop:11688 length:693 start_codon:yes stop_codon:yes gene_type:complete